MLLRLFKSDRYLTIILILVLFILLWIPSLILPGTEVFHFERYPSPLYSFFKDFSLKFPFLSIISAIFIHLLIAFVLVRLNTRFIFIATRTYLPALIYLLLASGLTPLHRFNPVILCILLIIYAISEIFSTFKYNKIAYQYFNASLAVGFSALIYIQSIYFIILIWAGLIIMRPFVWREWIFTIIGTLLPFLYLFSFYFFTKEGFLIHFQNMKDAIFQVQMQPVEFGFDIKIFMGVLIILIILASYYLINSYETRKIQTRKYYLYFLWMFIITLMVFIFFRRVRNEILLIMSIPLTYLFSYYFAFIKVNFLNNLLFTLLLLTVFFVCYSGLIIPFFK